MGGGRGETGVCHDCARDCDGGDNSTAVVLEKTQTPPTPTKNYPLGPNRGHNTLHSLLPTPLPHRIRSVRKRDVRVATRGGGGGRVGSLEFGW